jgi:hypothetical protein
MSTFLELCQKVARESGTVSGNLPTTVVNNTVARLVKIVNFTNDAWQLIQNLHDEWYWMQKEFSATITSASQRYSASDLNITDWSQWIMPDDHGNDRLTIYLTSNGVADEHPINYIEFPKYLRKYERGSQTAATPVEYSIAPNGDLCFGPIPDANHTVKGRYRKENQTLDEDDDEPELPARFHQIIVHRALLLLAEHDEAAFPVAAENRKYLEMLGSLELSQLMRGRQIITAGPLA